MIEIIDVHKSFGENEVLRGVDARIEREDIFTIIGPSGQGKSTLLRLINLLDTPTSGKILIDGVDIHNDTARQMEIRRKMGMVFQKPVVFNTTVYDNIATGLRFRHIDPATIKEKITEALDVIDLAGFESRKAKTLSGGEMQRIALARAMVTEPDILILDEPTANLDPLATEKIEDLIHHYNREYKTTVVMSTHDMQQGQRLADRIAVMMHGTFSQTGNPRAIFSTPKNKEVARFVGIHNILEGTITKTENGVATIDVSGIPIHALTPLGTGTRVCGCIQPEDITLHLSHAKRISALNVLEGRITKILGFGALNEITVDCGINLIVFVTWKSTEELNLARGDVVRLSFKAGSVHVVQDVPDDS
jgi:tungstate transport system ATP-binding protein